MWSWTTIKSSQKHHIWNSQLNLTSYTINVIFRLSCLGQLNNCHLPSQLGTTPLGPHGLNLSSARKYLVTKFKFMDSIVLTDSNPQSLVVLLCVYKEWHHLQTWIKVQLSQGTTYLYPSFPLIRPHKVVHTIIIYCYLSMACMLVTTTVNYYRYTWIFQQSTDCKLWKFNTAAIHRNQQLRYLQLNVVQHYHLQKSQLLT